MATLWPYSKVKLLPIFIKIAFLILNSFWQKFQSTYIAHFLAILFDLDPLSKLLQNLYRPN